MLTPHEFKRTRAARPRPDLGGDDLADLGTTCWCVGRISTDKHLSIGKAHAVRPKNWFVLAASGGPCGPPSVAVSVWLAVLVAASTGRRRGRPPWWRPSVWLVYWLAVLAAGVRPPCWWSVRGGVRPWPWWPFSWPLAAFRPSAGPLVRRGPFVALGGPCGPCVLALSVGSISAAACTRRRWCAVLVLACLVAPSVVAVAVSLAVLAGVAGVGVIAPCRGPWSVSLAASMGRRVVVCWWCHCAVPCWAVCRVRPSVLVSAVVGRWPSVRPCWCAGVRSVAGGRFLPCSVAVAARLGRRWCWCPSLVLAARVGLVLGLADWLAVWALPVVAAVAGGACACGGACLFQRASARAGWRWAVCGAFRGGGVRLPCLWWSLLVSHQRRPWPSV